MKKTLKVAIILSVQIAIVGITYFSFSFVEKSNNVKDFCSLYKRYASETMPSEQGIFLEGFRKDFNRVAKSGGTLLISDKALYRLFIHTLENETIFFENCKKILPYEAIKLLKSNTKEGKKIIEDYSL